MTTRKALIEKIQAMQLGTQEMLDAAKDDATLIPFYTLFLTQKGEPAARIYEGGDADDAYSVWFDGFGVGEYCSAEELRPMSEE